MLILYSPHSEPTDGQLDDLLKRALPLEAPAEIHARSAASFTQFREKLIEAQAAAPPRRPSLLLRFGWAGGGVLCSLAVLGLMLLIFSRSTVSWADVVKTFRGVKSFGITVYFNLEPLKPPNKVELWHAADGSVRIHAQNYVLFAQGKKQTAFDLAQRREVDVAHMNREQIYEAGLTQPLAIAEKIGTMGEMSLSSMLAAINGKLTMAPVPNADVKVSDDMEVFDVTQPDEPEWTRIWVLKKSGLPVRVRSWEPERGTSVEAVFDYMMDQPALAFDPIAFKQSLGSGGPAVNAIYANLKDPGGRQLTPADMFKATGYHMPEIKAAGRAPDGSFWVEAEKGINRGPNGSVVTGFGKLTDNLGREYLRYYTGGVARDGSLEIFVPLDYPFDKTQATTYSLTCVIGEGWEKQEVVGTTPVAQWQKDAAVPTALLMQGAKLDPVMALLHEYSQRENWDAFDKLAALIPGEPEDNERALEREIARLQKLITMNRDEAAFAQADRLYPIILPRVATNPWWSFQILEVHIGGLERHGRHAEAVEAMRRTLDDMKQATDKQANTIKYFVSQAYLYLKNSLQFSTAQIAAIFPAGTLEQPEIKAEINQFRGSLNTSEMDQSEITAPWREYAAQVAKRYESKPLPEKIEFLTGAEAFNLDKVSYEIPLPGHPDYKIWKLQTSYAGMLFNVGGEILKTPFIRLDPALKHQANQAVAIYKAGLTGPEVVMEYLRQRGYEAISVAHPARVWVAHYDGRKLPNWRTVKPLEWPEAKVPATTRAGGTSANAKVVMGAFILSANRAGGHSAGGDPQEILLIDETGLPDRIGPNQSMGSICLAYTYQFRDDPLAIEPAKAWFRDNFGITFTEETRDVQFAELHRN